MKAFVIGLILALPHLLGAVAHHNDPLVSAAPSVLKVQQGGTGAASFTDGLCLVGHGTGPFTSGACSGGGGGGAAYPFTPSINFSVAVQATSGIPFFQNGLQASSTLEFVNLDQKDKTATSTLNAPFQWGATAGDNLIKITAARTYPASVSSGGLVNITNTLSDGAGLVITTAHAGSATGRLFAVNCSGAAFDQDCAHVDSAGTADGLSVTNTNAGTAANAISITGQGDHTLNAAYTGTNANKGSGNFTSTNVSGSVLQVAGSPNGLGVIKSNLTLGTNDSSAISGDASGSQGQGLFVKGNAATTTAIINALDSNSATAFKVDGNRLTTMINATSTLFSTSYASSTLYFGAGLDAGCNGTTFLQFTAGRFGCGTPSGSGGGGTYPFVPSTTYSTTTSATSSSLQTAGAFFASSTVAASQFPYASSTALTAGNLFATQLTLPIGSQSTVSLVGCNGPTTPCTGAASPGADGTVLQSAGGGTLFTTAAITLSNTNSVTGILAAANGGTGSSTLSAGELLYGSATGGIKAVSTTTVSCAGTDSCTSFTIIGSTPITITGSGGGSGTYSFTPGTWAAIQVSATGTTIWDKGTIGFIASSSIIDFASSTGITANNSTYLAMTGGVVDLATTSQRGTVNIQSTGIPRIILSNADNATRANDASSTDFFLSAEDNGIEIGDYHNNFTASSSLVRVREGNATGLITIGAETGPYATSTPTFNDNPIFIGYQAGKFVPTYAQCNYGLTVVGNGALNHAPVTCSGFSVQGVNEGVIIGNGAGARLTSANGIIAIGYGAGSGVSVSGSSSTFIGADTGHTPFNGLSNDNTFIGEYSGTVHDGDRNVILGSNVLPSAGSSHGYGNVLIGQQVAHSQIIGDDNIFIGEHAGYYHTFGDNNIVIGSGADIVDATGNGTSTINIGNTLYATGIPNNVTTYTAAGGVNISSSTNTTLKFGVATNTPGSIFSIGGVANFTSATTSLYSTGGIVLTGGCITYTLTGPCIGGTTGGAGGGISDPFTHPTGAISATTTLLQLFGNASSTGFSSNFAFFGATATSTFTSSGALGISSSTPWGLLSVSPSGITGPAFVVGSSTALDFQVSQYGDVGGCVTQYGATGWPATSTAIVLDWPNTCNTIVLDMGVSAYTVVWKNATTSQMAGHRKFVQLCNPGSTGGAATLRDAEWSGTAPTLSTTASQCASYSVLITPATSTPSGPTFKMLHADNGAFQ